MYGLSQNAFISMKPNEFQWNIAKYGTEIIRTSEKLGDKRFNYAEYGPKLMLFSRNLEKQHQQKTSIT